MVALIQTLIAVMLIPIALVASSAFNDTTHGFAPRGSNSPTIGRSGHLPVSPYGKCGRRTKFGCDQGRCCSPFGFCGLTEDHCGVGCQSAFDVARNMVSVELRQSTVVLIASQSLAHVIPTRLLDLCQFQGVAGVEEELVLGLPQDTNPIRGLMYADDVAVFADSEQSLLAASTAVEQWAIWWEMQFGVAKCGIISFTGHLVPRIG
ncbi:hypothetical protein BASA83_007129 [Batrachochytrium salamandrivorans]|nr:hypothetical protein BASA83_007129 [Batrachochytrium salamandrivorans]